MPFKPLVMAGIESLLNTFLHRSSALKTAHSRLLGKVSHVEVEGFSTSLILVFSERQVDVLSRWADGADCIIVAYVNVLPKLRDRQQLAALIRNDELEVQGDIQVVQNFIALADLAEFNPAELLAPYIGDVAAEGISKALHGDAKFLHHGIKRQQCHVVGTITEEWHIAPGPSGVAWFAGETAAVERAVDTLTKRLEKLGTKWHQVKYGTYISSFALS